MNLTIANLFKVPEIRKKLWLTLGLLLVYRTGFHVPLPGVNLEAVQSLAAQRGTMATLFGIMNSLTGANIGAATLFSLGVMPYISASIIFSLLSKVLPALEKLAKEGQAGQRKINQYTRLATVPICLVQSFFIVFGVLDQTTPNNVPVVYPEYWGILYVLGTMVVLTAGTLFITWLGEQITEHGIGNGISLIIQAGIVAEMPGALMAYFGGPSMQADEKVQRMLLYILAWVMIVGVIVYITKGQRRIPIQQTKLTRGRKVYGGQRHFLPFKVNQAGVMPIIFASALMILPNTLALVPFLSGFMHHFQDHTGFLYIVFYCTLIIFFAYFWVQMMFQPKEIADNLREVGSFIPGIRPGKKTAEFIEYVITRITLAGAVFLCLIAIVPNLITQQIGGLNPTYAYFIGGTSILIVVEVALDMVERLNAQLVMRNYEGFMKGGQEAGWGRRQRT